MSDRRSQRIREQLRRHANPRSTSSSEPVSFSEQLRRVYLPSGQKPTPDYHSQLARQLEAQRKGRR